VTCHALDTIWRALFAERAGPLFFCEKQTLSATFVERRIVSELLMWWNGVHTRAEIWSEIFGDFSRN